MLTVDEQGFERFWGPSAIKPLNFNYDFQPTFVGQNIWTLTDDLFVSDHERTQDGETNENDFMKVIYSKLRNVGRDVQKKSSRYKQFPTIDQDIHQRSSSAQGSYVSRRLKIVGSPLSTSSQQSQRTPPKPVQVVKKVQKSEASSSTPGKFVKPRVHNSPKTFVGKKQPASPPKFTLKKRPQQSGLTLKLSQQETERLLKSLDFKVRTVRKPKPRDRSKSEALGREKGQVRTAPQKRLSASKVEQRKPRIKKPDNKKTSLENQGLLKSSRMSSSSGKNSRSSSGLNELVGPLPKVTWTPTRESIQQKKSSSASLKKKSSEKSGASVSKGSKTSANSKKLGKNPSGSQNISREPSSEENTISQQKVKTTRVKIIPKVTLNNQLLKSTTPKTESKQLEKKNIPKAPPKKKEPKAKTDSILWTPEKIALLDQITNDQQLKAVLMSAGDTYMKSKKYFAVKSNVKTKLPVKQASSIVKREPTDTKKMNNAFASAKIASIPTTKKPNKQGNADISKSPSKEEKSTASDTMDSLATLASKPETSRSNKSPEANALTIKKGDQKQVTNSQLLKTDGVPKSARPPKSPARKVANSQSPLKDNKAANVVAANKKRPKYAINSRQVRKVEERLAQLSAEVTGNSTKIQDRKVPQVQRTNLNHLRKIIDKSLSKFKEDNKAGEIKSD